MPMIRGQFPEEFQLDLSLQTKLSLMDRLTDMSYDEQPPEYADIYRVSDSDQEGEQDHAIGSFGLPQEQDGEIGGLHYDILGRWFKQTYIFTTFNLGYVISHQLQRDDKWGMAGHRAKLFGRSFRRLFETLGARPFNEGFSSTTQSGIANLGRLSPDGQSLFSTAHPYPGPGGGTFANRPSSGGADLAHASLEAMMIRMGNRTDDRGMPVNIPMKTLYVPWALYPRALEIVNSSFRTDTLNRVKNVLQNVYNIDVKPSHYLTNTRAWFGLAAKDMHGLRFIFRERPTRLMWKDNATRAIHVGGWTDFDFGWSHPFGVDGDPGLGG